MLHLKLLALLAWWSLSAEAFSTSALKQPVGRRQPLSRAVAVNAPPATTSTTATPLGLPLHHLSELLGGSGRAKMVWKALGQGFDLEDQEGVTITARTRREMDRLFPRRLPWEVVTTSLAECGTRKLLLRMEDGAEIETVIIPSHEESRSTVCVSSQVGCNRACSFCATGRMGFIRNLTPDEILAQVYYARRAVRLANMPPLTNIVFMGMGEPLNNMVAVKQALHILTDPHMFSFGPSHISVSTVGPSPQAIRQMVDMPARLAWSVHAATDSMRTQLVPTTKHTMAELRDAFKEVLLQRGKDHLFVEVAMLEGINDSPDDAQAMVELLSGLPGRTRVNLLPYNDIGGLHYRPSKPEAVKAFQHMLSAGGLVATIRSTRGAGEAAACGQLATLTQRKRQDAHTAAT